MSRTATDRRRGHWLAVLALLAAPALAQDGSWLRAQVLDTRALDCTQVHALPANEIVCLNGKTKRLTRYAADGKPRVVYGGRLKLPRAVAADARHVAVLQGDEVMVFGLDGVHVISFGKRGKAQGELHKALGLALAGQQVVVADTGNRRVQWFGLDGQPTGLLDKDDTGQPLFDEPVAVRVDRLGRVYVLDRKRRAVLMFGADRRLRGSLTVPDADSAKPAELYDLALDDDGQLYLLTMRDKHRRTVSVFRGHERQFLFVVSPGSTGLSLAPGHRAVLMVHDPKAGQVQRVAYRPRPLTVGGLEVTGARQSVYVDWLPIPSPFIKEYVISAAATRDGTYTVVGSSAKPPFVLHTPVDKRPGAYRIQAVSYTGDAGWVSASAVDGLVSAHRLFTAGEHEAAAKQLTDLLSVQPDNADALELLGRSDLALGRPILAAYRFARLTQHAGYRDEALLWQVRALMRAHRYTAAGVAMDRLLTGKPDRTGLMLCAELKIKLGQADAALGCIKRLDAKTSRRTEARLLKARVRVAQGKDTLAVKGLETLLKATPRDADAWAQAGLLYRAMGRNKDAVSFFQQALKLDGKHAVARRGAAASYLALGRADPARRLALAMVTTPGQEANGYLVLGRLSLAADRPQEAVLSLVRATAASPGSAESWEWLGRAYSKLGNNERAHEAWHQATVADPWSADAWAALARLALQQGRAPEAIEHWRRAIALEPGRADLRLAQALALEQAGRLRAAIEQARAAVRLSGKPLEPYRVLSRLYQSVGETDAAEQVLKQAIRQHPRQSRLVYRLARLYFDTHRYRQADQQLVKAIGLNRRAADYHRLRGQVAMERGHYRTASQSFAQAVKLKSDPETQLMLRAARTERKQAERRKYPEPRVELSGWQWRPFAPRAWRPSARLPVGHLTLTNPGRQAYESVTVDLDLEGMMDRPERHTVGTVRPGGSTGVELFATAADSVAGPAVALAEQDRGQVLTLTVDWQVGGKPYRQEFALVVTVHGRQVIDLAQPESLAALVTAGDPLLRQWLTDSVTPLLTREPSASARVDAAMVVAERLATLGVSATGCLTTGQVRVALPRDTLRTRQGSCLDTAVLLASLLEAMDVPVALQPVKGDWLVLIDSGIDWDQHVRLTTQAARLVRLQDRAWLPLAASGLIAGGKGFHDAWRTGAAAWAATTEPVPVTLRQAWSDYPVLGLPGDGDTGSITASVEGQELAALRVTRARQRLVRLALAHRMKADAPVLERAGELVRYGQGAEAERLLYRELGRQSLALPVWLKAGELALGQGQAQRALELYRVAAWLEPDSGAARFGLARAWHGLGQGPLARRALDRAVALDPALRGPARELERALATTPEAAQP